MNEMKQNAIDNLVDKIGLLSRIAAAIENLPDDMGATNIFESCEDICVAIPFDIDKIRAVRNALDSDWRISEYKKPSVSSGGTWFAEYYLVNDPDIKMSLMADPTAPGATCSRVKVGTETHDVYQIVCGAEVVASPELSVAL